MASNFAEEILPCLGDEKGAINWCKEKGILKATRFCDTCKSLLILKPCRYSSTYEAWECENRHCPKHAKVIMGIEGSFFTRIGPILNFSVWIHLFRYWCNKENIDNICVWLNVRNLEAGRAFQMCQEFLTDYFRKFPIKLGGENIIIPMKIYPSIDGKRLMMMVEKDKIIGYEKRVGYLKLLDSFPDYLTELSIVENALKPGSVIASDEWGSPPEVDSENFQIINCNPFQQEALRVYRVNSCYERVLQNIDRVMSKPQDYLSEFLWRERYHNNAFENFIEQLKNYYESES